MEQTRRFFLITFKWGFQSVREFFDFIGGSTKLIGQMSRRLFTRPFYLSLFIEQCYTLGVKSLTIVFVTAVSTGAVMALQFGFGLERFGGKLYVPRIVGMSIMRELGPVLTCLILAGRVGSGIASEIGSMNVSQQIDAIRALGTDPIKRIVIPRVLAMVLMTPLLTVLADMIGVFGGMAISMNELNIDPAYYFNEGLVTLKMTDFLVGVVKTVFFGFLIANTACYYGLKTKGGTQGVGQATTRAVVTSSILIVVYDFVLTKVFWIMERGF